MDSTECVWSLWRIVNDTDVKQSQTKLNANDDVYGEVALAA